MELRGGYGYVDSNVLSKLQRNLGAVKDYLYIEALMAQVAVSE
jgi:hypothetical protein